ncbi:MAG: hypothetical protein AAF549_04755 [Pseudomonadota bacterium]
MTHRLEVHDQQIQNGIFQRLSKLSSDKMAEVNAAPIFNCIRQALKINDSERFSNVLSSIWESTSVIPKDHKVAGKPFFEVLERETQFIRLQHSMRPRLRVA